MSKSVCLHTHRRQRRWWKLCRWWQNRAENKWWGVAVCRNILNTNSTQIMLMASALDNPYSLLARARLIVYFSLTRTFQAFMMILTKKYWWCFCLFIYLFTELMNKLSRCEFLFQIYTSTVATAQNHRHMANDFLSIFNKYCHCDVWMDSIVRWLHRYVCMYTKAEHLQKPQLRLASKQSELLTNSNGIQLN